MSETILRPVGALCGQPRLPHDKSISHRALMLAALAFGHSRLHNIADNEDVAATRACLEALGTRIEGPDLWGVTHVHGMGPKSLRAPQGPLDCGNSGTTMRLMMGLIAGLNLSAPVTLQGDASLSRRPMARVAAPLAAMGANIELANADFAPVVVLPSRKLVGRKTTLKIASGQLKGALLLAGLHALGDTTLKGALHGRDHTERLMRAFGAEVRGDAAGLVLTGGQQLLATTLHVPKDFSAAAFWLAAAAILPKAHLLLEDVGLNPSRTGFLRVLEAMGAEVYCTQGTSGYEPVGTLGMKHDRGQAPRLQGVQVVGEGNVTLIDELPLVMLLGTQAHGTTFIGDAEELRVKETDRLWAMADNLARMGAAIALHDDGCTVKGPMSLRGARLHGHGDHRIAMAMAVASMICKEHSVLVDAECIAVSDPHFLSARARWAGSGTHHNTGKI